MATKKSESPAKGDTTKEAERQTAAAIKSHDDALKAKAEERARTLGFNPERVVSGPSMEVRTAKGANGESRTRYVKGGQRFGVEPRTVALGELTREQFHAIVSCPLLEVSVDSKSVQGFDGFAPS